MSGKRERWLGVVWGWWGQCSGVKLPSGLMYPQCDWLGLPACIPDTGLCSNRPFPVAGLGQRSFLLLSRPAPLPAQIRLLKEKRRPASTHRFFAPLQASLSFLSLCSPHLSDCHPLCLCFDGLNLFLSIQKESSCTSTLEAYTRWLPTSRQRAKAVQQLVSKEIIVSVTKTHYYLNIQNLNQHEDNDSLNGFRDLMLISVK